MPPGMKRGGLRRHELSSSLLLAQVPELRAELGKRGVPATGLKAALIEKLIANCAADPSTWQDLQPTIVPTPKRAAAPKGKLAAVEEAAPAPVPARAVRD